MAGKAKDKTTECMEDKAARDRLYKEYPEHLGDRYTKKLLLYKEYTELADRYHKLADALQPFILTPRNQTKFMQLHDMGDLMAAKNHELLEMAGLKIRPVLPETINFESMLEKIVDRQVKTVKIYRCRKYAGDVLPRVVTFVDGDQGVWCEFLDSGKCAMCSSFKPLKSYCK
jgi:hypothetical protein